VSAPDQPPSILTRRHFLGGLVTLVCAAPLANVGCGGDDAPLADGGPPDAGTFPNPFPAPPGTTLRAARWSTLAAAMDALLPTTPDAAGATQANAAWYLDQLLGAFSVVPPRIYPGGPYSGRHGGPDSFSTFQRLTRVEELRWRTYLEGSMGLPEREWNGPVEGAVARYEAMLDDLDSRALARSGAPFVTLGASARVMMLAALDPALLTMLFEHTVEGTYGDPIYGGNRDGCGWSAIDYEGDRQPVGYTARQMSHPEEA
jgi:hypothetical protein